VRLDLTEEARTDLDDILDYGVRHWGIDRGFAYVEDIRAVMDDMLDQNKPGGAAEDIATGLRRQFAGSHSIWFRLNGERLVVIRVLHQSRDAGRWVE
jgi:toxin ParE1/3/4